MRRATQAARLLRAFSAYPGEASAGASAGAAPPPPTTPSAPSTRRAAKLAAAAFGLASLPTFWETACESADVASARRAVAAAWDAVDADIHRAEAGVPRGLLGLPPPPTPPSVVVDSGGNRVTVSFSVRPGADRAAVVDALVAGLPPPLRASPAPGGGLALMSESDASSATLRGVTVEVAAPAATLASAAGAAALEAALRAASTLAGTSTHDGAVRSWSWRSGGGEGGGGGSVLGSLFGEGGAAFPSDPAALLAGVDDLIRRSLDARGLGDGDGGDAASPPLAGGDVALDPRPPPPSSPSAARPSSAADAAVAALTALGCTVIQPPAPGVDAGEEGGDDPFARLAGYAPQKAAIADAFLPLTHAAECAAVAAAARAPAVRPRAGGGGGGAPTPRAVLFEGPPGCGKTTAAAAAAAAAGAPLIVMPVESVLSRWYGDAEKNIASVFEHARTLARARAGGAGGAAAAAAAPAAGRRGVVLFIDEIDSLATSRSDAMHEATRRCLGVLLRSLDGVAGDGGGDGGVVAVLATNRRQDVDPALASRCAARVHFPLPSQGERQGILALYAAHLPPRDTASLARAAAGLSGRDLRDAAEAAERRHAAAVVRGEARAGTAPPAKLYADAVAERAQSS